MRINLGRRRLLPVDVLPFNPVDGQIERLNNNDIFVYRADIGAWESTDPTELVFEDGGTANVGSYLQYHAVFYGNSGGPALSYDCRIKSINFVSNGANPLDGAVFQLRKDGVTVQSVSIAGGTGPIHNEVMDEPFLAGERIQVFLQTDSTAGLNDTFAIVTLKKIITT